MRMCVYVYIFLLLLFLLGAYNISSSVGADAPRISMAARTSADKNTEKAPGPGISHDSNDDHLVSLAALVSVCCMSLLMNRMHAFVWDLFCRCL